jgi:hypothetical protein
LRPRASVRPSRSVRELLPAFGNTSYHTHDFADLLNRLRDEKQAIHRTLLGPRESRLADRPGAVLDVNNSCRALLSPHEFGPCELQDNCVALQLNLLSSCAFLSHILLADHPLAGLYCPFNLVQPIFLPDLPSHLQIGTDSLSPPYTHQHNSTIGRDSTL